MSQNIVPQFERLEKKTLIEVSMKDLEKKTLIEDPMEESKEPEHSHHSIANKNHSQVIELEPKVIINPNRFPQNKEGNVRDNKSAIFENNPEPNYIELEENYKKQEKILLETLEAIPKTQINDILLISNEIKEINKKREELREGLRKKPKQDFLLELRLKSSHEPHNNELKLQINALEKYLNEGDLVITMTKPKKKVLSLYIFQFYYLFKNFSKVGGISEKCGPKSDLVSTSIPNVAKSSGYSFSCSQQFFPNSVVGQKNSGKTVLGTLFRFWQMQFKTSWGNQTFSKMKKTEENERLLLKKTK